MNDYDALWPLLQGDPRLMALAATLPERVQGALDPAGHGDLGAWLEALASLPSAVPSSVDFDNGAVRVGRPGDLDDAARKDLEMRLRCLHPWRKGPFELYGIRIDTEWRSDWKWNRLAPHIAPLVGRRVLDVGCGSGYHCWRMLGAGAEWVLGIDPTLLFVVQFLAVKRLAGAWPVWVLPLGIEDLPPGSGAFDTVFSMGVLHHRRSPLDHLYELRGLLRPGGELVLETLTIEGDEGQVLLPPGRYARMRNVWFLPSPPTLAAWLRRCGFRAVRVIDASATTVVEQRATDWMRFQSLADFLDPADPRRTVEGLPAPRRAILLAERP